MAYENTNTAQIEPHAQHLAEAAESAFPGTED